MVNSKKKIVIICGPTGIGKTSIAIELAKKNNAEIISADSMQIYKHMNIGTAKPTKSERQIVKHHLVDFILPTEDFDAFKFAKIAKKKVCELYVDKKKSFIVGGTGLYIKSLLYGLPKIGNVSKKSIEMLEKKSLKSLYNELKSIDAKAIKKIHPNDKYRIIRALSVYKNNSKTLSSFQETNKFKAPLFDALKIGIKIERDILYKRINQRVDMMIEEGLVDEVKKLFSYGFKSSLKPMQSLGYRHIAKYLLGDFPLKEAINEIKKDTRRYAKRQLTWFRKDKEINWFAPSEINAMQKKIISLYYSKV